MKIRTDVMMEAVNKPFVVTYNELGDYESLKYDFLTYVEAVKKYEELIKESRKSKQPFYVEITERMVVCSEE